MACFIQPAQGQTVYEIGTFVSLPAGKHINHSYYGNWEVFFATEDGVLIYSHQEDRWLDPITASDGLSQYPALLVWYDEMAKDIWIVTPDYVFVYDRLSAWMSRHPLPREPVFQGTYELREGGDQVVLTAYNGGSNHSHSALFTKGSGAYVDWGPDSTLMINWESLRRIGPGGDWPDLGLTAQVIQAGRINIDGFIYLDGYPAEAGSEISSLAEDPNQNETFLGSYGMGVFYRQLRGGQFQRLPFGLLSPDVMTLTSKGSRLLVGGRAGLTTLDGYTATYDEALTEPSYDLSFISSIDVRDNTTFIGARGGIFRRTAASGWERFLKLEDLVSKRVYTIASGADGLVMIGTERNAHLYHRDVEYLSRTAR